MHCRSNAKDYYENNGSERPHTLSLEITSSGCYCHHLDLCYEVFCYKKLYSFFAPLVSLCVQKYRLGKQSCKDSTENSKDGILFGPLGSKKQNEFVFLISVQNSFL